METSKLIEALRHREAYPDPPPGDADVLQTHISVLFFTPDRVYKVKKPVRLDFVDYSTLDRRRHFCAEEVRLNRRLAPGVYLGVAPINRAADGTVRVRGAGDTIEHAVEMIRLPEPRMMSVRLERGEVDNEQIETIATRLSVFHRDVATGDGVDEHGHPEVIAAEVEENFRTLDAFVSDARHASPASVSTLSPALRDHLYRVTRDRLERNREVMEARVRAGRIREGHGDLHAGNICLMPRGIVIYDCIEFSRRFRCRDVACELAFLAMDLDARGFRGFAGYLLRRYATLTGDPDLPDLAALYKLHLAVVRGKVASLRAADQDVEAEERREARAEAMRYLHLAASYTLGPFLVLMCGLPATGKSHAARAIARPFEAAVVRSDVVRKELAGLDARERGASDVDEGIYTPAFTQRAYEAVRDRSLELLRRGTPVIADATFSSASRRRLFLESAVAEGLPCLLVETACPEEIVRERLRARAKDPDEVSDADWRIYQRARERFDPPDEVPAFQRLQVGPHLTPEEVQAAVIDRLLASA